MECTRELQVEEQKLEELLEAQLANALPEGPVRIEELGIRSSYAERLKREIPIQRERIAAAQEKVDAAMAIYVEATRDEKTLVTLREKRLGEHEEKVNEEEEKFLDELSVQRRENKESKHEFGERKKLSREEAGQLYDDLKKAMTTLMARKANGTVKGNRPQGKAPAIDPQETAKQIAAMINGSGGRKSGGGAARMQQSSVWGEEPEVRVRGRGRGTGQQVAVLVLLACALAKIGFAVVEMSGVVSVERAEAAMVSGTEMAKRGPPGDFTREEVAVLTSLDQRRADLEERRKRLDDREVEVGRKEQVFAAQLTQLKELTDSIKGERDKSDRKQEGQLDQLANVYGSMNPEESATLLGQLDTTIALALLKRMPEKRLAQILAAMAPEKALTLTRMLSGK